MTRRGGAADRGKPQHRCHAPAYLGPGTRCPSLPSPKQIGGTRSRTKVTLFQLHLKAPTHRHCCPSLSADVCGVGLGVRPCHRSMGSHQRRVGQAVAPAHLREWRCSQLEWPRYTHQASVPCSCGGKGRGRAAGRAHLGGLPGSSGMSVVVWVD